MTRDEVIYQTTIVEVHKWFERYPKRLEYKDRMKKLSMELKDSNWKNKTSVILHRLYKLAKG